MSLAGVKTEGKSGKEKTWTVSDVLKWTTQYFNSNNISEARLDAEVLLSYVLDLERLKLYLEFDRVLKKEELNDYKSLIKRRLDFIPVAYLVGQKEFMGLGFFVNKHVLIPRPETELLAETVINKIKEGFPYSFKEKTEKVELVKESIPQIIDLGVGCGNIAVSIAKYVKKCKIYAIDVSQKCLEVAFHNSKTYKIEDKITFLLGSLFYSLEGYNLKGKIDFIVSNPPYVKTTEFDSLPLEVKQEPYIALNGGQDGMDFYHRIISQSLIYLKEEGYLILEIGDGQKEEIVDLMEKKGFCSIQVVRDYSGIERLILAQKCMFKGKRN
ncbi:peptide chain release factor N(5)-glutamine methyltransferase [bacterium]|nr:peptide chain release factor N(5)-glutamine methyltransferase [bacterium]